MRILYEFIHKRYFDLLLLICLISFIIPPLILNLLITILLLISSIVYSIKNKYSFKLGKLNILGFVFILYYVACALSLLVTFDLNEGLVWIVKLLFFALFPVLSFLLARIKFDFLFILKNYIRFILIVFFFLLVYGVWRGMEIDFKYLNTIIKFNSNYLAYDVLTRPIRIQPVYLALFVNISVVFLFYLNKIHRVRFFFLKLFILSAFIALLSSRTQILALIIIAFFYFIFYEKFNINRLGLIFVMLFSSILLISLFNPVTKMRLHEAISIDTPFYKKRFGDTNERLLKWESSIKVAICNPFFGVGIGDAQNELNEQFKKDEFYIGYYNEYNSHNQYIDTTIQLGLIGLLILLSIFFLALLQGRKNMLLFFLTIVFMLSFCTESMLNRQWGAISFPFFIILFSIFNLPSQYENSDIGNSRSPK